MLAPTLKTLSRHLIWFAAAAVTAALLISALGWVPVAASKGHWPPVKWFLHFTMQRSVRTQARGIVEPSSLDDPALIGRGAGAYALNCASCHGAPGEDQTLSARLMIPPAPRLTTQSTQISRWRARELFWIVRNGIKYTAMPAWAAQARDDEVWAVVAFLRNLPELSARRYATLAFGDAPNKDAGPFAGVAACMHCHGVDGGGRNGVAPRLAGQARGYLSASLREYADGSRPSGIMQPVAATLSDQQIEDLAYAFSRMTSPQAVISGVDAAALARGARIAQQGVAQRDVAPCDACHAPAGGQRHPRYPLLHGQSAEYQMQQLRLFRLGIRAHSPAAALMADATRGLSESEAGDVSLHYQMAAEVGSSKSH